MLMKALYLYTYCGAGGIWGMCMAGREHVEASCSKGLRVEGFRVQRLKLARFVLIIIFECLECAPRVDPLMRREAVEDRQKVLCDGTPQLG